jgi:hypothetical protein
MLICRLSSSKRRLFGPGGLREPDEPHRAYAGDAARLAVTLTVNWKPELPEPKRSFLNRHVTLSLYTSISRLGCLGFKLQQLHRRNASFPPSPTFAPQSFSSLEGPGT